MDHISTAVFIAQSRQAVQHRGRDWTTAVFSFLTAQWRTPLPHLRSRGVELPLWFRGNVGPPSKLLGVPGRSGGAGGRVLALNGEAHDGLLRTSAAVVAVGFRQPALR